VIFECPRRVNRLLGFETTSRARAFARVLWPATHVYFRWLARLISRQKAVPRLVLDAGTGPGCLLGALRDVYPSTHLIGLDSSRLMLAQAQKQMVRHCSDSRISLVQGDVYKLPFPPHCFDLVVCTGLLHHLDDLAAFFGDVLRVLRPGGVLLAIGCRRDASWPIHAMGYFHTHWMRLRGTGREGLHTVLEASWTRSELEKALIAAGFHTFRFRHGLVTLSLWADSNNRIE
jgi:ubiquinone/menaquinone biosynthesis C-methylase UbiE